MIRDMDVHERLADAQFFPDADRALEHAEDRLLATLDARRHRRRAADACRSSGRVGARGRRGRVAGVDDDRATLCKGRGGVPTPAIRATRCIILLQGQIGIWLPATHTEDDAPRGRRLISFAPGVVFGDMGLLAGAARSADAIAESDALVLELQREPYERLVAEHPAVFGKLLLNISLLLASRVRSLSDELQAAHAVG